MTADQPAVSTSPRDLERGSLVYLWAPGDDHYGPRILARVEKATTHNIVAEDLARQPDGSHARGAYEVGGDCPPGLRWTWELAAPAPKRCTVEGVEQVQRDEMTFDARRAMLFGQVGAEVLIRLRNADAVRGVVSLAMMDGENTLWIQVDGAADGRGPVTHVLRFADIVGVTR